MELSSERALTFYGSGFAIFLSNEQTTFKALSLTLIIVLANLRSMKHKMMLFALTCFADSKIKLLPLSLTS